jgi:hypothetical protein
MEKRRGSTETGPKRSCGELWGYVGLLAGPGPSKRAVSQNPMPFSGPRIFGPRILGPRLLGPRILGSRILGPRPLGPRILGPRIFGAWTSVLGSLDPWRSDTPAGVARGAPEVMRDALPSVSNPGTGSGHRGAPWHSASRGQGVRSRCFWGFQAVSGGLPRAHRWRHCRVGWRQMRAHKAGLVRSHSIQHPPGLGGAGPRPTPRLALARAGRVGTATLVCNGGVLQR